MSIRHLALVFAAFVLVSGCGGGGGNPGTNSANPTVPVSLPTVTMEILNSASASTSTVNNLEAFTLRATVRDAAGALVDGVVVTFTDPTSLVVFAPANTALTKNGVATLVIAPKTPSSAGATSITADASVAGVAAKQANLGVQVVPLTTGGKPTVTVVLQSSATGASTALINSSAVYTLRATVRDALGVPVSGQVVKVAGDLALVKFFPANGAAVTDSTGLALIQVIPANGAASGAGFLTADAIVNGAAANQVTLGVQVVPSASGGLPTISMEMKDPAGNSTSSLGVLDVNTVRVTVRDAVGNVAPGKAVTFSSTDGLVKFLPVSSAISDSNGQATVQVLRANLSSSGVDTISAAVSVANLQAVPATLSVYVSPTANAGVATMSMIFKDVFGAGTSSVPRGNIINANVTVLDALGKPVPGTLVTFTGDSTLINFPASKLTNSAGVAIIQITAVAASDARASTLRASATFTDPATNSSVTLAKSYDFEVIGGPTVSNQAPVISAVQIQNQLGANSTVVSASTNIYTVRATLKDSLGSALAGQLIRFTGDPTLVKFSPANGTALTDQFGVGVVQILPATATSNGAGAVGVDATVAGLAAKQATVGYTVVPMPNGGQSSIILRENGSTTTTVSALSSKTLSATVKDADGNALPGQIVNFTTVSNKLKFSPASSAVTNLGGVATVDITRNLPTDVGTEVVTASVTVGGVSVTPATMNVSISPLVNGGNPTATINLLDNTQSTSVTTLSRSLTSFARVKLTDALGGVPVPTVVTLSGDASLLSFNATGLTDAVTGVALIPLNVVSTSAGGASTLTVRANVPAIPGSTNLVPVLTSIDYLVPSGSSAGVPTLALGLQGGGTTVLATGATRAIATVKDASGAAVAGKLVTFEGNATLVKFSPTSGQVLTDATGVATITVSPVSVLAAGASTISAKTSVGTQALATSFDFQLADSNVVLGAMSLGGSLPAYGTRAISIPVTVSGAIPSSPVQVSFSPNCGTVTPSTATTDSLGIASATFTATSSTGCAGANVSITASTVGSASVTGSLSINTVAATNLQFVSATPQLIYLGDSAGPTQSQVIFKVLDAAGNALANRIVRLSLPTNATGVGINSIGGLGPVDVTSDSNGNVSVAVFSGTVPTSFTVTGTLLDGAGNPTTVRTNSNVLTVAVGRPVQRSLSLSFAELAIEGYNVDGTTTSVTLSLADRAGNPVPPGTQVNFVTESGVMIPPTCFTTSVSDTTGNTTSQCKVTIRSQGTRPLKGLVSVMAYAVGEEDFIDANGNNIYEAGETFTDLGRATMPRYLDNVATSSTYTTGDFQVPRVGAAACVNGGACAGDGVWGSADVRKVGTIAFATGSAQITATSVSNRGITFRVEDRNGNSMPTQSQITVAGVDQTANAVACTVVAGAAYAVPNTLSPSTFSSSLKDCASGDSVFISVTSKLGLVTTLSVAIP